MVSSAVKKSHFDVMNVKFLFCSFVILRDYWYSKLEVPMQLKNVPPNATALRIYQVHPWWYNFSGAI